MLTDDNAREFESDFRSWQREKMRCGMSISLPVHTMYCMCCTCKRESGAQIWYKGLLENITWNIQFVFFSFYSTVSIFSLTFN